MPIKKEQPKTWLVNYNEAEQEQYNFISQRLRSMSDLRQLKLKILNDKSIEQRYIQNQEDHVNYTPELPGRISWKSNARGTQSRTKLHKLISFILGENLGPIIKVFNKNNEENYEMSKAWTYIVRKTNEVEDLYKLGDVGDAALEALTQGTVFIEEIYDTVTNEKNKGKFNPKNLAEMRASQEKGIRQVERVYKKVLPGTSVYLGSLSVGSIQEQPDVAIRTVISWDEAKSVYGDWERWAWVEAMKGKTKPELQSAYERLNDVQYMLRECSGQNEDVEVVRYLRKYPQTYQIYLNGVQMLPENTCFPWGYDKYNIVQRMLYPLAIDFPYGSSIYDMTRTDQGVLDMLTNMDIDQKRQLLEPSISILNKNVQIANLFRPNTIHRGINPEDIKVLSNQTQPNSGVWQTIQHYNTELDKMFNATTMGQPLSGEHSATEVSEMQKSAARILGYVYMVIEGLIKDCAWLRMYNIVANCIGHEGRGARAYQDGINTELLPVFQEYVMDNVLLSDGKRGKMKVRFIPKDYQEKVLRSEVVMQDEDLNAAERLGFNKLSVLLMRKQKAAKELFEEVIIDPVMMQSMEWNYGVETEQMTKNTSAFERAEFREFITDAANILGPDALNLNVVQDELVRVHKAPKDIFKKDAKPVTPGVANQQPNMPTAMGGDGNVVAKEQGKNPEMSNQLMASVKRRQG